MRRMKIPGPTRTERAQGQINYLNPETPILDADKEQELREMANGRNTQAIDDVIKNTLWGELPDATRMPNFELMA